jgi:hypothetical protein
MGLTINPPPPPLACPAELRPSGMLRRMKLLPNGHDG